VQDDSSVIAVPKGASRISRTVPFVAACTVNAGGFSPRRTIQAVVRDIVTASDVQVAPNL